MPREGIPPSRAITLRWTPPQHDKGFSTFQETLGGLLPRDYTLLRFDYGLERKSVVRKPQEEHGVSLNNQKVSRKV